MNYDRLTYQKEALKHGVMFYVMLDINSQTTWLNAHFREGKIIINGIFDDRFFDGNLWRWWDAATGSV